MNNHDQQQFIEQTSRLDAMLQADAQAHRDHYIDNDGFSDRVMARVAALPVTTAAFTVIARRRLIIVWSAAILALVMVMTAGAGDQFLVDAFMDLATKTITPNAVGLLLIVTAAGILGVGAANSER